MLACDLSGQILDHHRHSVVELLLENYHRQMVLVGHDVATMKQEVESMQVRSQKYSLG